MAPTIEPGSSAFRPTLFGAAVPADMAELERLKRDGRVVFTHDTLASQVHELVETRAPDRRFSSDELARAAMVHTNGSPSSHGAWAYYPWSGRVVHILPEAEFEEVRTSRNRNKITRDEQTRLARWTVGVVGLSVGQSTAVTLALEGIGGAFRLADFDTLSLSNMNRLRAGVHEIGVNKAALVAREIYEINPYARVEIFDRGVTDETFEAFFGSDRRLDVLFEECDDLKMKFRLREEARRRRIPVLMETSDRGLFDVERFDREPERPLFHGLVGEIEPERLAGMSTYEKVPVVLDILGAKTMSRRMAASLIDIDATLKTWPQLASAVALGGAINADAARRIALGRFQGSGRFFVDLETLVSDEAPPRQGDLALAPGSLPARSVPPSEGAAGTPSRASAGGVRRSSSDAPVDRETLERLVTMAALAPSGGNCQPWRFTYRRGVLRCWHVPARSRSFLDFEDRATCLAFGALTENLRLAAGSLGVGIALRPFPEANTPALVCEARLGEEPAVLGEDDADLARQIALRVTNRRVGTPSVLSSRDATTLEGTAARAGARLELVTSAESRRALGDILGLGERLRLTSAVMHREMMGEIRWSAGDTLATRDGLDIESLELTPTDRAGMRLVADWSVMATVREVGGGHGLVASARKQWAAASAGGLLTVPVRPAGQESTRELYFRGGVALQRVWLRATSLGISFQPMTALLYLFARLEHGAGAGLDDRERRELVALRLRFREVFPSPSPTAEMMVFRLAVASPPTARSLRRTADEILVVEPDGEGM